MFVMYLCVMINVGRWQGPLISAKRSCKAMLGMEVYGNGESVLSAKWSSSSHLCVLLTQPDILSSGKCNQWRSTKQKN